MHGSEVISQTVLNSAADRREGSASRPCPFISSRSRTLFFNRRCVAPELDWALWRKENSVAHAENRSLISDITNGTLITVASFTLICRGITHLATLRQYVPLLRCYAVHVCSCLWTYGTAFQSHLQGSSSQRRRLDNRWICCCYMGGGVGGWMVHREVKEPIKLLERKVSTRAWKGE